MPSVTRAVVAAIVGAGALAMVVSAQSPATSATGARDNRLPLEPLGASNEAIWPAYEGWGASQDGTSHLILLGYMNRNRGQAVQIPIGPNNRIEPGGPDYGQPTVFEPGRQIGVFAIKVPKDFGTKKLTWTLVANGQPAVVTFYLNPQYNLNFYRDIANGNEPPAMKFGPSDPMLSGPIAGFAQTLKGTAGQPVPLRLWASDPPPLEKNWETIVSAQNRGPARPASRDQVAIVGGQVIGATGGGGARGNVERGGNPPARPDITVTWKKVRGPGVVTVKPASVPLVTKGDRTAVAEANATAIFSAPGEYVLRAQPAEAPGAGDGLCCITFANIRVIVN
jgi:hypothetical protein